LYANKNKIGNELCALIQGERITIGLINYCRVVISALACSSIQLPTFIFIFAENIRDEANTIDVNTLFFDMVCHPVKWIFNSSDNLQEPFSVFLTLQGVRKNSLYSIYRQTSQKQIGTICIKKPPAPASGS